MVVGTIWVQIVVILFICLYLNAYFWEQGSGTAEERKDNIRELLNFFPVIGEDEQGELVELDAEKFY